ncbi:DUF480 domain-containing protein [Lacipirellula limnantheis]|uniref:DUF480 domain-containing protein n=1 Tax=Lacipirellula limnantheis TaxID=2528024 RepID=A0A517U3U5_9BACT|nr:DUF480 domain-containing protein [Lacipirellula limnantheis]QDT75287.1 hypothetical protein I41_44970 [Lacipirellula limnantheis]
MSEATPAPKWRLLERIERRVAGVLVEKAKTTPDNYPLSVNALLNGCNQKNNRFPQMTLDEDQVTDALDSLRKSGAVALIQGDGRVEKYRHLLYDWLGVDKFEMAVMAELLLRGAQTLGELRGRAARMEPIKDIGELGPIVERLRAKNLLIFLTPPGRGGVVTHNLYQPQELAKVRAEHGGGDGDYDGPIDVPAAAPTRSPSAVGGTDSMPPSAVPSSPAPGRSEANSQESRSISAADGGAIKLLADEVTALKREFAEYREQSDSQTNELRRELEDLKRQLGV